MTELLRVDELSVHFPTGGRGLFGGRGTQLAAVDRVSFSVEKGTALGIVGESGCGKSTLARTLAGLLVPTSGRVSFAGVDFAQHRDPRAIQMVFQDPGSSLNPALSSHSMLSELLKVHRLVPREDIDRRCLELLELVNLPKRALHARPRELSGGQRQRLAIARALALEPQVLIADEAVAALDVSVQATILNLLADLREQLDITVVLISHDLSVIRQVCDEVAVMYLGRIVETADVAELFDQPRHPYTQALLRAVPRVGMSWRPGASRLRGEMPSPTSQPTGCKFRSRCPLAAPVCAEHDPQLEGCDGHLTACHFAPDRQSLTHS